MNSHTITLLESSNNSSNSVSSTVLGATSNPILYIILGVLVALFLGWILFQYIKDRIKKKKLKAATLELENISFEYANELTYKINYIIKENQYLLDNFQVSIGDYKMGELTNSTKDLLNSIIDSHEFKTYIIGSVKFSKIPEHLLSLRDTKSNNWKNRNENDLNFFEFQTSKYEFSELSEDKKEEIRQGVIKFYEEKLHSQIKAA